ncbi:MULTISPECIES: CopG family ribbon-helix-helix protein [unclassified Nostoc]|uniref:CopG family ribbon-helix-helix protein n=1 Tax=unclassified Nostoc TaxID=2593658 RepID=UPI00260EACE9|nr:ribbon-helix-helix protein, CopG family [Nostoc sp. S13]MDF5739987.1 ribbon-helix-helix protein, CopG family [Nostoc sp. S13]
MSSTITVRIDDASKVQLDILARSTRRTKSWLAAQAIEAYLKREAAEIDNLKCRYG